MLSIFYIGKRTLFDILRTGVFWVTLVLLGTILFLVIYNGFRTMKFEMEQQENLQDKAVETEYMEEDMWEDPLEHIKPEVFILWIAFVWVSFVIHLLQAPCLLMPPHLLMLALYMVCKQ